MFKTATVSEVYSLFSLEKWTSKFSVLPTALHDAFELLIKSKCTYHEFEFRISLQSFLTRFHIFPVCVPKNYNITFFQHTVASYLKV